MSDHPAPSPPTAESPATYPTPPPATPAHGRRTPRPGELTAGWRLAVAGIWCGVALAFAAVWSASVQLGLTTWWLSPQSGPDILRLTPFVPAVLMIVGALNNVRWLGWWGLGAAAVLVLVAVGDLDRVTTLAAVEFAIAAAAAASSVASLAGTFRRVAEPETEPGAAAHS